MNGWIDGSWADQSLTHRDEFDALDAVGALPPSVGYEVYSGRDSPFAGLLAVWKEWLRVAPKSRRARAARIHSSLEAARRDGAELTFGVPGCDGQVLQNWIGYRAFWWPRGVIETRCVGLAASRLRRDARRNDAISEAIRLSLTAIDIRSERLLALNSTSLSDHIETCGRLFGVPLLRVQAADESRSSTSWIDDLTRVSLSEASPDLLISPVIDGPSKNRRKKQGKCSSRLVDVPVRDLVLALLSRKLFVLKIRRDGNWWKILHAGFEDGIWKPGFVRVLAGSEWCADEILFELQELGAVAWHLSADQSTQSFMSREPDGQCSESSSVSSTELSFAEDSLIRELVKSDSETDWLTHWTRSPMLEWAGESHEDYLRSLAIGEVESRTAFGTLCRIAREGFVRATPGNTRVAKNVVCFSSTPLIPLLSRRVFRPHRGRWDFEHYGICIAKRSIRALGGRPVIYGDEETWRSLPDGERLWFQPATTRTTAETINWKAESEWRLPTDLELARLPDDDVFLYCATSAEAVRLRSICRWRVIPVDRLMVMRSEAESSGDQ